MGDPRRPGARLRVPRLGAERHLRGRPPRGKRQRSCGLRLRAGTAAGRTRLAGGKRQPARLPALARRADGDARLRDAAMERRAPHQVPGDHRSRRRHRGGRSGAGLLACRAECARGRERHAGRRAHRGELQPAHRQPGGVRPPHRRCRAHLPRERHPLQQQPGDVRPRRGRTCRFDRGQFALEPAGPARHRRPRRGARCADRAAPRLQHLLVAHVARHLARHHRGHG